ncbi:MAG TPA: DUF4233 domain-containing protein [Pseudonocardia sp.]|jgi:Protein of unknown function (DUF4233)|nr:DUF4233 domain-containing protein [Pseudonocardia sp.]
MTAPDPMKGLRGIFAATLVLEAIVVGLALLLPTVEGTATWVIAGLALLMVVAAGLQRRPWGLAVALALQAAMIACGLLAPALGLMGIVFALVWAFLLYLRRDVARRLTRS